MARLHPMWQNERSQARKKRSLSKIIFAAHLVCALLAGKRLRRCSWGTPCDARRRMPKRHDTTQPALAFSFEFLAGFSSSQ